MTCRNLTALYTKFRDDHKKANNPWPEFLPQLDDLKQVVQAIPSWTKKSSSNCLQMEDGRKPLLEKQNVITSSVHPCRIHPVEKAPIWTMLVTEIQAKISHIGIKMESLSTVHTRRLLVTFDASREEKDELEIDQYTHEITVLFQQTEQTVKRITYTGPGGVQNASLAESQIRMNMQRAWAQKVQTLSIRFRKRQNEYLKKVQVTKGHGDENAFWGVVGDEKQQNTMLNATELMVEERDMEIQRISNSMQSLSDVFKELATMIIDQGSVVDRIDYNMEQVVNSMQSGLRELVRADRYQKSSRAMKCIGFLVAMIIGCFAILVIKHS